MGLAKFKSPASLVSYEVCQRMGVRLGATPQAGHQNLIFSGGLCWIRTSDLCDVNAAL